MNYCAVNPHGKFIEELTVLLVHLRIVKVDKVFRLIFAKDQSLLVDKHFGENENYVALTVLKKYFEKYPDISTEEAIQVWNSFGLPKHALETEQVFAERTDRLSRFEFRRHVQDPRRHQD